METTNVLDVTDIRILELLQSNARLSNKEIADKLHKTPTPIFRRIKRLEDEGYIQGYIAVLNPKKLGRGQMAFTHVQLKDHSQDSLSTFESAIIKLDEVLECFHMSGDYDFILRVMVPDLAAYHHFLMQKLFPIMPVGKVQSTFVFKESKHQFTFTIDPKEVQA